MKRVFIILLIICFVMSLKSQEQMIYNGSLPEAEFHVAMNPTDSNNIVVATIHGFFDPSGNNFRIYYTRDFGNTWLESNYHGEPSGCLGAGDPVLAFDSDGNVFLVNLTVQDSTIKTILSKSVDGGATWNQVSYVTQENSDKPWLAIDRYSESQYKGNIYIPLIANNPTLCILNKNYEKKADVIISDGQYLPSVVVRKDGDVFLSLINLLGTSDEIVVSRYSNGGMNMVHSTKVVSFSDFVYRASDISPRFQPSAYLAVDNSEGAHKGRLYLSYTASEAPSQAFFDVFLVYSDDNGVTWSTPKVVNKDKTSKVQQYYSSLFVNDMGDLLIDWYDRTNYGVGSKNTDFFLGISRDGGDNFTQLQLNSVSSDFGKVNTIYNFGIGEYHQLVATNNTALSFWSDGRENGDLNIYMAKVSINNPTSVDELSSLSSDISISNPYPQPITDKINFDITLQNPAEIKFEVADIQGKIIWSGRQELYLTGKHTIEIPSNFSQGTYFIRVNSNNRFLKNIKIIKP